MGIIKKGIFFLLLGLICIPSFQEEFNSFNIKPLRGFFESAPLPEFSDSSWFNGAYQINYQKHINDSIGFRPFLVRLYNQIDFSFFSIPHAERVVVGKKGELFATGYIRGYLGQDFLGEKLIDEKVRMLKVIQDVLWKTRKIFLFVLIPPDKGSYCPERIPDRFLKMQRKQTGRDYFTMKAAEEGVNVLDFNPWFRQMKDTTKYALFPTTGVHWTDYGSWLAADSATRYIKAKTGINMPKLVMTGIEISQQPRHNDDDINKTMNLIWDAPHVSLAYPQFRVDYDPIISKPSCLFIGDSFFWGWWDQGIIDTLFSNKEFWYYNKEIFPESFTKVKTTSEINLKDAVERQNIVVLFQVGAGGGDPGTGFIETAYAEFDTSSGNKIREIEQKIKSSSNWLEAVKKKAIERKIPLEEMVRIDAIGLFTDALKNQK